MRVPPQAKGGPRERGDARSSQMAEQKRREAKLQAGFDAEPAVCDVVSVLADTKRLGKAGREFNNSTESCTEDAEMVPTGCLKSPKISF